MLHRGAFSRSPLPLCKGESEGVVVFSFSIFNCFVFFFQLVQVFHLYIADVPVYINDDGYGDGCFASGNPDGEQGEEKAFQLFGEEITVEHGKVDIH